MLGKEIFDLCSDVVGIDNKIYYKWEGGDAMDFKYHQDGDFLYPNIIGPEEDAKKYPIGRFGRLRGEYLKEHAPYRYRKMWLDGSLWKYLSEIDAECYDMMDILEEKMKASKGVTEELKASNQMLWVWKMNGIRYLAEEIVLKEIVYA